ncbi:MAG: terminase large subunit [Clostridium sp.]
MIKKKVRRIIYESNYNPVLEYWREIESKKVVVSLKVYKVYEELVKIMNDPNSIWEYDSKKANHAMEFVENYCKHSKGKMGGKPFIMELWQKALVASTFGFIHKIDGTRKHREIILVVARKNGKSTLASAIGLYMQIADGEPGAEVYAVATRKDQAKVIWLESKRMVKKSPTLLKRIKPLVGELIGEINDSIFKPLGSDSDGLDGLNVHCGTLDEIHAWKDKNLYDVIVDGTTAREEPIIFITTTAGTIRESVYDMKYDECERIINGYIDGSYVDERVLPIIYELDNRKEWIDEECWAKANPGLGTIKKLDQLQTKVNKAKANALLVKNLLCKDFNIRETSSEAWLTYEQLNNQTKFDLVSLKPKYGIGGADLSATTDLTNATVIFMVQGDPNIYVMQMYWLPEDLLEQRVKEDKIPYDIWRDMGLLRTVEGNKVHYKHVTEWFLEVQNELDIYIPYVGYDSWSASYWVEEMKKNFGKESMEPVIQGKRTLSGPMKGLGADLEVNKIVYDNNPVLKWCLSNTSIEVDKNDNIQPHKGKNQRKRIDGTAGLLNAYVTLERHYDDYMNMI